MRNRDPNLLDWCLCYVPHLEEDGDQRGFYHENGSEPDSWFVGRVSDLDWGVAPPGIRSRGRLRHITFNRFLDNVHGALEWQDARIRMSPEYVGRVLDDELEAYRVGDLLRRSTRAYALFGDAIMGNALRGVRSLLIKKEEDRAENIVREQEAFVEKFMPEAKLFQSKMLLLLDTEDFTEILI